MTRGGSAIASTRSTRPLSANFLRSFQLGGEFGFLGPGGGDTSYPTPPRGRHQAPTIKKNPALSTSGPEADDSGVAPESVPASAPPPTIPDSSCPSDHRVASDAARTSARATTGAVYRFTYRRGGEGCKPTTRRDRSPSTEPERSGWLSPRRPERETSTLEKGLRCGEHPT